MITPSDSNLNITPNSPISLPISEDQNLAEITTIPQPVSKEAQIEQETKFADEELMLHAARSTEMTSLQAQPKSIDIPGINGICIILDPDGDERIDKSDSKDSAAKKLDSAMSSEISIALKENVPLISSPHLVNNAIRSDINILTLLKQNYDVYRSPYDGYIVCIPKIEGQSISPKALNLANLSPLKRTDLLSAEDFLSPEHPTHYQELESLFRRNGETVPKLCFYLTGHGLLKNQYSIGLPDHHYLQFMTHLSQTYSNPEKEPVFLITTCQRHCSPNLPNNIVIELGLPNINVFSLAKNFKFFELLKNLNVMGSDLSPMQELEAIRGTLKYADSRAIKSEPTITLRTALRGRKHLKKDDSAIIRPQIGFNKIIDASWQKRRKITEETRNELEYLQEKKWKQINKLSKTEDSENRSLRLKKIQKLDKRIEKELTNLDKLLRTKQPSSVTTDKAETERCSYAHLLTQCIRSPLHLSRKNSMIFSQFAEKSFHTFSQIEASEIESLEEFATTCCIHRQASEESNPISSGQNAFFIKKLVLKDGRTYTDVAISLDPNQKPFCQCFFVEGVLPEKEVDQSTEQQVSLSKVTDETFLKKVVSMVQKTKPSKEALSAATQGKEGASEALEFLQETLFPDQPWITVLDQPRKLADYIQELSGSREARTELGFDASKFLCEFIMEHDLFDQLPKSRIEISTKVAPEIHGLTDKPIPISEEQLGILKRTGLLVLTHPAVTIEYRPIRDSQGNIKDQYLIRPPFIDQFLKITGYDQLYENRHARFFQKAIEKGGETGLEDLKVLLGTYPLASKWLCEKLPSEGLLPLDIAIAKENYAIIKLLIKYNAPSENLNNLLIRLIYEKKMTSDWKEILYLLSERGRLSEEVLIAAATANLDTKLFLPYIASLQKKNERVGIAFILAVITRKNSKLFNLFAANKLLPSPRYWKKSQDSRLVNTLLNSKTDSSIPSTALINRTQYEALWYFSSQENTEKTSLLDFLLNQRADSDIFLTLMLTTDEIDPLNAFKNALKASPARTDYITALIELNKIPKDKVMEHLQELRTLAFQTDDHKLYQTLLNHQYLKVKEGQTMSEFLAEELETVMTYSAPNMTAFLTSQWETANIQTDQETYHSKQKDLLAKAAQYPIALSAMLTVANDIPATTLIDLRESSTKTNFPLFNKALSKKIQKYGLLSIEKLPEDTRRNYLEKLRSFALETDDTHVYSELLTRNHIKPKENETMSDFLAYAIETAIPYSSTKILKLLMKQWENANSKKDADDYKLKQASLLQKATQYPRALSAILMNSKDISVQIIFDAIKTAPEDDETHSIFDRAVNRELIEHDYSEDPELENYGKLISHYHLINSRIEFKEKYT